MKNRFTVRVTVRCPPKRTMRGMNAISVDSRLKGVEPRRSEITASGVWSIAGSYTIGIALFNLPLEEMVFFGMTNLLVVWGVTLLAVPGFDEATT